LIIEQTGVLYKVFTKMLAFKKIMQSLQNSQYRADGNNAATNERVE